jgi:hypothetical protein
MTSRTNYTATAGQTSFAIPFRYLLESFVKVTVNGTALSNGAGADEFTVTGSTVSDGVFDGGNVVLNTGATAGDTVAVYRDSGIDDANRLVDFEAGARLLESDLDKSALQLLHLLQEVKDNSATAEDMTITIADVVGLETALAGKASTATFTTATNGIVPGPTANQAAGDYFLRADGSWVTVSTGGGGGGGGATAFTDLSDVPNVYTGQANKFVAVADSQDGLTFTDAITSLGSLSDVNFGSSTPNDGDAIIYDGASSSWLLSPAASIDLSGANAYQEGNLLVGNGNGSYTPLGNGTSGQVLTVNTAVAGNLEWATAAGGTGGDIMAVQTINTQGDINVDDGQAIPFDGVPTNRGTTFTQVATNTYLDLSVYGGIAHTTPISNAGIRVSTAGIYKIEWRMTIHNTFATDLAALGRLYVRPASFTTQASTPVQYSTGVMYIPGGKNSMVAGTAYIDLDANDTIMLTLVGQNAGTLATEAASINNFEIVGQQAFMQIAKV